MTSVMLVYSSLFARWAWVVKPQNLALCACHVSNVFAQSNQMRRAINHKIEQGQQEEVNAMGMKAGAFVLGTGALIAGGPALQTALVGASLGPVSTVASAAAGPFTVHFWAPMSKWLISGASFLDLNRPTDKVSITQYTVRVCKICSFDASTSCYLKCTNFVILLFIIIFFYHHLLYHYLLYHHLLYRHWIIY